MLTSANNVSYALNDYPDTASNVLKSNDHALIGVSTFNSYFSVQNMEKLFLWASENFKTFHVFFMDDASKFNLMAMGYNEQDALRKMRKHDKNIQNRIIKSFINIGFKTEEAKEKTILLSRISRNKNYCELYNKFEMFFNNNTSFKNDCLLATQAAISNKIQHMSEEALYLAVKYLLLELPLWLNTPYILNISSSVLVYNTLSFYWERIFYHYGLLSPNQEIFIKDIRT